MNGRWLMPVPALALAFAVAACGPDVGAAPPTPLGEIPDTALLGAEAVRIAGIRVEPVVASTWSDEWSVPARLVLDPAVTQPLGAIVEGRVTQVLVHPGDRVQAGQVLVTIHSHEMLDARAAHAAATAALVRMESDARLAESAAARAERLYAGKALSVAELERARAAAVDAEALRFAAAAELERAGEMLTHLTGDGPTPTGVSAHEALVRSPLDGVVTSRTAQPGQVAVVGTPLVTVSRTSNLQLVLNLPEGAVGTVSPGAVVNFSVQANPQRKWNAVVSRVAPTIDVTTRTLEVLAQVHDPTGQLRPEMFATASLRVPGSGEALTVPAAAVQTLDGDTILVVAEQRGEGFHIRAAPVRIGRRNAEMAEVLSGVRKGESVIVEGAAIARAEILRRREGRYEEP